MEGLADDPLLGFSIDDDDEDVTVLDPLGGIPPADGAGDNSAGSASPPESSLSTSAASVSASVSANAAALMSSLNSSLSEEKTASMWSSAAAKSPAPAPASALSGGGTAASAATLLQGNEERIVAEHLGRTHAAANNMAPPVASAAAAAGGGGGGGDGVGGGVRVREHPLGAESAGQPGQVSVPPTTALSSAAAVPAAALPGPGGGAVSNGAPPIQSAGADMGTSHDFTTPKNNAALKVRAQKSASAWYENVGSLARRTANTLSDAAVQAGTAVAHAAAQADVAVSTLDQRVVGQNGVGGAAPILTTTMQQQSQQAEPLQQAQANQPDHSSYHEMDNTKKSALLSSALAASCDGLLPGERVIMFLSHLSNVRDSAGTNTGINTEYDLLYDDSLASIFTANGGPPGSNGPGGAQQQRRAGEGVIWCCAMTFYRVILFTYRECDFPDDERTKAELGKGAELESGSTKEVTDVAVSDGEDDQKQRELVLDELVRTSSVSRQYQLTQASRRCDAGGRTKRHHVLQMPLASIERVERVSHYVGVVANGSESPFGTPGTSLGLILYGKDNYRFLRFTAPNYNDAVRAHEALNTYAFPGRRNLGYLFAFESRRTEVMASIKKVTETGIENGGGVSENAQKQPPQQQMITARSTPRRYQALREFERMGILRQRESGSVLSTGQQDRSPSPWKTILTVNSTYTLCPSYPSVLVGPRHISDDDAEGQRLIRRVAAFRSEGRMPVLTWGNSVDGASIWRSSQPRVGLQGNRSSADEHYLRAIADCASNVALPPEQARRLLKIPSRQFLRMLIGGTNEEDLLMPLAGINAGNRGARPTFGLKIMDLRPKSSAVANRTQGYGYENTSYYTASDISFYGIGNIHAVRDSYQKISSLCQSPSTNDVQWAQLVEDTKWLSHIRLILSASWQVAFHVHYNRLPVLLHCSHGWDRTSQVAAIAELLLDPFYRTKAGFSTLIEKDFMAFGHPFHTRCGHGEGKGERGASTSGGPGGGGGDEGQISQIFIQFLDCVFQLVNQYPEYFEFNSDYLLVLSEHVYSCRFGTLLCDTERERELVAGIRQRTHCLWEYLDSRSDLTNPFYSGTGTSVAAGCCEEDGSETLMMPLPVLLRNVTLWVDRFCMYGPKPTIRCMPLAVDALCSSLVALADNSEEGKGRKDETESSSSIPCTRSSNCNSTAQWALKKAEDWKRIAEAKQREIDELTEKLEEQ